MGSAPNSAAACSLATMTAAPPSLIWEAFPGVVVPSGVKTGRRRPSDSNGDAVADALVVLDAYRLATASGDIDGDDLVGEVAAVAGAGGPLVATDGPLVLLLAEDAEGLVLQVGGLAHRAVIEGAEEAVVVHRIDELAVAEASTPARIGKQVGGVAHRLHATRHDHAGFVEANGAIGHGDSGETGEADLVDRGRGHAHGNAGADGCLAGRDLARARLHDVPEEHLVDGVGRQGGAVEGAGDGGRTELRGAEGLESPAKASDGCSRQTNNDRLHGTSPVPLTVRQRWLRALAKSASAR